MPPTVCMLHIGSLLLFLHACYSREIKNVSYQCIILLETDTKELLCYLNAISFRNKAIKGFDQCPHNIMLTVFKKNSRYYNNYCIL